MTNFIIHALPRSRTAWLSRFLTYKDHTCGHELAMTMRTPEDYKQYFSQPNTGSAETGAMQGWWLIEHARPGIKTVVINRDLNEIIEATLEINTGGVVQYDRSLLHKHYSYGRRLLDKISTRSDVLTVEFNDLKKMETCQKIFEHCLPYEFDIKWWAGLKNKNIQVNLRELLKYYHTNLKEIQTFKHLCKQELYRLRKTDPDNVIWKD